MSFLTIRAHFDGKHVLLDEPCQLEPDAQLLVIVLPKQLQNGEYEDWARLSLQALDNAYGEHESVHNSIITFRGLMKLFPQQMPTSCLVI